MIKELFDLESQVWTARRIPGEIVVAEVVDTPERYNAAAGLDRPIPRIRIVVKRLDAVRVHPDGTERPVHIFAEANLMTVRDGRIQAPRRDSKVRRILEAYQNVYGPFDDSNISDVLVGRKGFFTYERMRWGERESKPVALPVEYLPDDFEYKGRVYRWASREEPAAAEEKKAAATEYETLARWLQDAGYVTNEEAAQAELPPDMRLPEWEQLLKSGKAISFLKTLGLF